MADKVQRNINNKYTFIQSYKASIKIALISFKIDLICMYSVQLQQFSNMLTLSSVKINCKCDDCVWMNDKDVIVCKLCLLCASYVESLLRFHDSYDSNFNKIFIMNLL